MHIFNAFMSRVVTRASRVQSTRKLINEKHAGETYFVDILSYVFHPFFLFSSFSTA